MTHIRPVILSPMIEQMDQPETWDLFRRVIQLKLQGYGAEYPAGVLPIDTTDFYAHHLILGQDEPQGLRILTAYKAVPLSRSDFHHHVFPGQALVEQAGSAPHVRAMKEILDRCRREGREIAYLSSWTSHPETRRDPLLKAAIRDIFTGVYVRFLRELHLDEVILGGTLRFKTEAIFHRLGYEPLSLDGASLPLIHVHHLFGETVQVLHMKDYNLECYRQAKKVEEVWRRREVMGPGDFLRRAA